MSKIEMIQSWRTTDGKCFANMYEAEAHQQAIDARQKYLSELKGAQLTDVQVEASSGDISLFFKTKDGHAMVLSVGGSGGDETTHTQHELARVK